MLSADSPPNVFVDEQELDTPFYFTPSKIASSFHAEAPALIDFASVPPPSSETHVLIDGTRSALLNAGHQVSRSHAAAGSLKSTATRSQLHDVFRTWVKSHPVKLSNIKNGSPTLKILAKEARYLLMMPTVHLSFTCSISL
jgi:tRNA (guanine26-N2/guanine27-N2)-dimethyltransferase